MADTPTDALQYELENGTKVTQDVPAGSGAVELANVPHEGWIAIDDTTRIRAEKIVCVRLFTSDRDSTASWRPA